MPNGINKSLCVSDKVALDDGRPFHMQHTIKEVWLQYDVSVYSYNQSNVTLISIH